MELPGTPILRRLNPTLSPWFTKLLSSSHQPGYYLSTSVDNKMITTVPVLRRIVKLPLFISLFKGTSSIFSHISCLAPVQSFPHTYT